MSSTYFKACSNVIYISSMALFISLHVACFHKDDIPYKKTAILGQIHNFFAEDNRDVTLKIYLFLIGAHIFEACVAVTMALSKGVTR